MQCLLAAHLALAMILLSATAEAQRRVPGRSGSLNSGPAIGAKLPDVTALDENGNEISLRSMRGRHTVLVFGCLT